MSLREAIDDALRKEMITIGTSIDDARTGQMWAFDSERLSKQITLLIIERVKGIEEPNWINRWEELGFKGAIQAVIQEVRK